TSLLTRLRYFKKWVGAGWRTHWQWWIRTIIAACALAAAIVPLYLHLPEPRQQVDADAAKLLFGCVEQGKCVVRIEPVAQADNEIIARADSDRLDNEGSEAKDVAD